MLGGPVIDAVDIGPRVQLHGFGGFFYGQTDNENNFARLDEDGDYSNRNAGLSLTANPVGKLHIYVQFEWEQTTEDFEDLLDYGFGEMQFTKWFHLRLGQVKLPFMRYTEVYSVGTLRPFLTLPQSIYAPVTIIARNYRGIGINGAVGGDWEFQYDIYGGELQWPSVYFPYLGASGLETVRGDPVGTDMAGGGDRPKKSGPLRMTV